MFFKKINNLITTDKFLLFIIFFISFFINKNYANNGVFSIDTFYHFDHSFRVLNGEYPIKDFWVVSGIFVDYLGSLFFYIFGSSWSSYVIHSSFINGLVTIFTYFTIRSFKLQKIYSFLYSILFGILAYTPSGTPFADHHSTLLSMLGVYCFILAINKNKNYYWIFMPILLGLAFLSKQVPAAYIITTLTIVTIFYSFIKKEFNPIKYSIIGSLIFLISVFLVGFIQEISLTQFLLQYIIYPLTIGSERTNNFNFNLNTYINPYKFLFLSLLPLIYLNIKKIIINKKYINDKNFHIFLVILLSSLGIILHQMLTKNQIFIYFLCPLLLAFLQIYFKDKNKKIISLIILVICISITIKYHLRFNEGRKFHELGNVNLSLAKEAYLIDEKLKGLHWITGNYSNHVEEEINFLKNTIKILKKDKRKKMVLTNYQFFSIVLNENLHSPSRSQTLEGLSFPIKGNKYYSKYKNYFLDIIQNNGVQVIYIISSDYLVEERFIYDYLDKACIEEQNFTKQLKKFEIKKC